MRFKLIPVASGLVALGLLASPDQVWAGSQFSGAFAGLSAARLPVEKAGYYGRSRHSYRHRGFRRSHGYGRNHRSYGYGGYRRYRPSYGYGGYRRYRPSYGYGGYSRSYGYGGYRGSYGYGGYRSYSYSY